MNKNKDFDKLRKCLIIANGGSSKFVKKLELENIEYDLGPSGNKANIKLDSKYGRITIYDRSDYIRVETNNNNPLTKDYIKMGGFIKNKTNEQSKTKFEAYFRKTNFDTLIDYLKTQIK